MCVTAEDDINAPPVEPFKRISWSLIHMTWCSHLVLQPGVLTWFWTQPSAPAGCRIGICSIGGLLSVSLPRYLQPGQHPGFNDFT